MRALSHRSHILPYPCAPRIAPSIHCPALPPCIPFLPMSRPATRPSSHLTMRPLCLLSSPPARLSSIPPSCHAYRLLSHTSPTHTHTHTVLSMLVVTLQVHMDWGLFRSHSSGLAFCGAKPVNLLRLREPLLITQNRMIYGALKPKPQVVHHRQTNHRLSSLVAQSAQVSLTWGFALFGRSRFSAACPGAD